MVDPTFWEMALSTFAFVMFAVVILEIGWGVGLRLLLFALTIVAYALFALTMVITLAYDIPVSLVRGARGGDKRWRATIRAAGLWSRFAGSLGPQVPREIDIRAAEELGHLLALSPTGFEIAVADLLNSRGYRSMRRVGGAGDLSVDLVGRDPKGRSVAVQCKRFAPGLKIGSPEIQKFIGMTTTHHRVDHAIFVTTSGFTKPASDLAKKHKIELIDGVLLAEMLIQRQPQASEEGALVAELEGTGDLPALRPL